MAVFQPLLGVAQEINRLYLEQVTKNVENIYYNYLYKGVPIPPTSSNIQQRIEAENKLLDTILAMNPTNGDKLRVIDTGNFFILFITSS